MGRSRVVVGRVSVCGGLTAACVALLALAPGGHPARAENVADPGHGLHQLSSPASVSRSLGLPWSGRLSAGVYLAPSRRIRHLPRFAADGNFYGTVELVRMLQRSARAIAHVWPGSRLTVGELSSQRGGWIAGHRSHRSGRDVDVAFYMRDARGHMQRALRFVPFAHLQAAHGMGQPAYQFDDERNWALVASMLRDPDARVQYMFVAEPIRRRLLKAGYRAGAGQTFLRAAAAVMTEPKQGHKHADHFHVRIFCSRDDRPACVDETPYWPWYDGRPPDGRFTRLPRIHWRQVASRH